MAKTTATKAASRSTRGTMRGALSASLDAEAQAFRSRLAKAEAVMGGDAAQSSATIDEQSTAPESRLPPVVREAFTIPESEHAFIEEVRKLLLSQAVAVTKSEVIRAGLAALAQLPPEEQARLFAGLEKVRTGRPKASSKRSDASA